MHGHKETSHHGNHSIENHDSDIMLWGTLKVVEGRKEGRKGGPMHLYILSLLPLPPPPPQTPSEQSFTKWRLPPPHPLISAPGVSLPAHIDLGEVAVGRLGCLAARDMSPNVTARQREEPTTTRTTTSSAPGALTLSSAPEWSILPTSCAIKQERSCGLLTAIAPSHTAASVTWFNCTETPCWAWPLPIQVATDTSLASTHIEGLFVVSAELIAKSCCRD